MTETLEDDVLRKIKWRPMATVMFFMSLLDRANISFASLEMRKDLGLSTTLSRVIPVCRNPHP